MVVRTENKEKELIKKIRTHIPIEDAFISAIASTYTELPYHHFVHALEVTYQSILLSQKARQYGVESNLRILVPAGLGHDSEYHKPIDSTSYATKEALAAHNTLRIASILGINSVSFSKGELDGIVLTILATEPDAIPETPEQKILRASDLVGFAGQYDVFFDNATRLRAEEKQLSGKTYTDKEWVHHVIEVAEHYLSQDIKLTPEHDDETGFSVFHRKTRENVELYSSAMGQ